MKILLVNMPCSSVRPPLGASLLKARLEIAGHDVMVLNANIDFASRVGTRYYHYLAEVAPVEALLGEYLFAGEVFPDLPSEPYLELLASRFGDECPAAARELLVAAKEHVPAHLDHCTAFVAETNYDLVGFSTSFTQNMASLALAAKVKTAVPETIVAFGGANCEDQMGVGLHRNFPVIDLVFCGEADISFPQAVERLAGADHVDGIPGVVWRDAGTGESQYSSLSPERIKDLDDLPFPDYDDFFSQYTKLPEGSRVAGVPMETSRGCWWGEKHHCTFCGLNGLSMAFRAKSPDRALAELDHLQRRYGVEDIQMVDNILDMKYVKSFLPRLADRPVKPALFYETKANLTWEQLVVFREAGIRAIQAGVESLDTRVLKLMDKGTTAMRSVQLLKQCREVGIWPHWNILYGFPGEPPNAYSEMAKRVEWLLHLDPPNVCTQFRLDRFSPLFVRAAEFGLVGVRPAAAYFSLYQLPEVGVRSLAYYFDFDYEDGRTPDAYTEDLRHAVSRWQGGVGGDLVVYKHEDGRLTIVDTRAGCRRECELHGAEADLYRACTKPASAEKLRRELAPRLSTERVDELLAEWDGLRIVAEFDGRFLALAVDALAARHSRRHRKPSWRLVLERSLGDSRRQPVGTGLFSS